MNDCSARKQWLPVRRTAERRCQVTQSEQRIRQEVEKHGKDKCDADAQVRLPLGSR